MGDYKFSIQMPFLLIFFIYKFLILKTFFSFSFLALNRKR